ncbi:hypothetical protein PFISCL1PPCAC_7280, partial [Pristionchus fissidentatus]
AAAAAAAAAVAGVPDAAAHGLDMQDNTDNGGARDIGIFGAAPHPVAALPQLRTAPPAHGNLFGAQPANPLGQLPETRSPPPPRRIFSPPPDFVQLNQRDPPVAGAAGRPIVRPTFGGGGAGGGRGGGMVGRKPSPLDDNGMPHRLPLMADRQPLALQMQNRPPNGGEARGRGAPRPPSIFNRRTPPDYAPATIRRPQPKRNARNQNYLFDSSSEEDEHDDRQGVLRGRQREAGGDSDDDTFGFYEDDTQVTEVEGDKKGEVEEPEGEAAAAAAAA